MWRKIAVLCLVCVCGPLSISSVAENIDKGGVSAVDLEEYLYGRVKPIILSWNEPDIYAISFFVYANESFEYRGTTNVGEFHISYNTESFCENAPEDAEERWNYAFWQQNETAIVAANDADEGMRVLFDWYERNGVTNVGHEDVEPMYDENMHYIGKGAVGYYELLCAVSNVAHRIQEEGLLPEHFGKAIPIIVHDLEYSWYVKEAVVNANPNGEADVFLQTQRHLFEIPE